MYHNTNGGIYIQDAGTLSEMAIGFRYSPLRCKWPLRATTGGLIRVLPGLAAGRTDILPEFLRFH